MRTRYRLCILFILSCILIETALAVSIGISPGRIRFDETLQGGYAERTITITTNTDDILFGHFDVRGEIAEWVSFEPNTDLFNVTASRPYKLTIVIEPPEDMPPGNYTGQIDFVTDAIGTIGGRAGGVVKAAVTLIVNAEVTGEQNIQCRAGSFRFDDVEEGFPLALGVTVFNDGNVRIRPTITVDVWDQLQDQLLLTQELTGDLILPTTEERITRQVGHELDIGQYWVRVTAEECNTNDFSTFSVVEQGAIIDSGLLNGISNKPDATIGETVEFLAKFENKGPRAVQAKFKGNIRLDDVIVKVVDTEEVLVDSGATTDFSVFFTPQEPGRYVLSGRVTYNKKLTFEKGSVLLVDQREAEESSFAILPLILYLIIIITIVFIFRKIVKERNRKHRF